MTNHLPHHAHQAHFPRPGLANFVQCPRKLILEAHHSIFHLIQSIGVVPAKPAWRLLVVVRSSTSSAPAHRLLRDDRFPLRVSLDLADLTTHLDALQIRLATRLEVWVLKLPDVVLDLSGVLVNMFDLPSAHASRRFDTWRTFEKPYLFS